MVVRLKVTLRAAFLMVLGLTVPDFLGLLTILLLEAIDISPIVKANRVPLDSPLKLSYHNSE